MEKYIVVEKRAGRTPLQELRELQKWRPELAELPLTYAGRLDPMAEGKLLVLLGDECKKKEKYNGLDKEYEFEVLVGFATDTGDVLGLPRRGLPERGGEYQDEEIRHAVGALVGTHTLSYPNFSSKTVGGKPLFEYALEGGLDTVEIPKIPMRVFKINYLGRREFGERELLEDIEKKLALLIVEGNTGRINPDFRREKIKEEWRKLLPAGDAHCVILKFRATVGAGTYIRALAPLIAEKLGTDGCGLAYSIKRTKIGKYVPFGKIGFWLRIY